MDQSSPSAQTKLGPAPNDLHPALENAKPLGKFLSGRQPLELEECRQIVDQALRLVENLYVHLPLKRTTYAVDPVRRLRLLQLKLERRIDRSKTAPAEEREALKDDLWFHRELSDTLTSVRDLHTIYHLPDPFDRAVAFLPFQIEEYFKDNKRKFAVTQIIEGLEWFTPPPDFKRGVEVTHWNGIPIERAVELAGERNAGSNPDARLARGLARLTFRPLVKSPPPDERWVTLRYRDESGQRRDDVTAKWYVARLPEGMDVPADSIAFQLMGQGLDYETDVVRLCKRDTFGPKAQRRPGWWRDTRTARTAAADEIRDIQDVESPSEFFQAKTFRFDDRKYGYIRIRSFKEENHTKFLDDFITVVKRMPSAGLVIDVRDNPGGYILSGERLLQVLTPRTIRPEPVQFINSSLSLQVCKLFPEYLRWEDSIDQAMETGATYSASLRLSPLRLCNDRGQHYFGPVVLITNGLCYSTTDIFAAGFQDNKVGVVLGTDGSTGAGGANVIALSHLLKRFEKVKEAATFIGNDLPKWPLGGEPKPLPRNADLRIAIRRTLRVGKRSGSELEDLGVRPEHHHAMTLDDLLDGNAGLIADAAKLLRNRPSYDLQAKIVQNQDCSLLLAYITTKGIDRLDVFVNGRPVTSKPIRSDGRNQVRARWRPGQRARLKILGYARQNGRTRLVAARKIVVK